MDQSTQYKAETRYTHIREAIGKLIDKGQSCIDEEKQQKDAQAWANDIARKLADCRKKWNEQSFQVAILALIKAGKSTLINSWLGNEFMPAATQPETARIVRVRHNPANERGTLRDGTRTQIDGAAEINDYLRKLNAVVRVQSMKGEPPPLDELMLEASLVTLAGRSLGEQRFEILDTPGPNEAGIDLKKKVEELLDQVDVIIYLLDYTKLKANDEALMLAKLAEVRLDLLNSERLFFVVNKVDQKNRNSPELKETAAYVADILRKQIPGLRVTPDRILLISAEQALLARLVESGKASPRALTDFSKKVFGVLAEESDATLERCQPVASKLFNASMMLQLEDTILSSIYSRRGTILLESLLGDLDRHLKMFYNNLVTRGGALQADQSKLKVKVQQLDLDIDKIQKGLDRVTNETMRFQNNISLSVKKEFDGFRQEVDDTIRFAFGSSAFSKKTSRANSLFSKVRGWLDITSSNRYVVEQAAESLIKEVADYLTEEFRAFMSDLGKGVLEQQKPLFEKLRREVTELGRQIEKVVGETLQVSLLPVPVVFDMPGLVPLDQAIGVAVSTSQETITRIEKERYVAWKLFWVIPMHKVREVVREDIVTTHGVAAGPIQKFWHDQINKMTTESLQAVKKKIDNEIRVVIQQAENELKRFSDNYVNIIRKSMEDASQDEQHRKTVLERVEYRTRQLEELLKMVADFQEVLAQLKAASGGVVSSKG